MNYNKFATMTIRDSETSTMGGDLDLQYPSNLR